MKTKHTPAPWIRKGETVWNDVEIMYVPADNFETINPSQTLEANASLIAAAPELLKFVEFIALIVDIDMYDFSIIQENARAAIAKATGQ